MMGVRIGVDVGGTFTKAVACDASTGKIVARAVVPTTHAAISGVAEGVIAAVGRVSAEVSQRGLGPVLVVSHSTTQAVNALLEGDTSVVGVLGIGRRPDVRRSRKRTEVGEIKLAPGRKLKTIQAFLDVSDGLDRERMVLAIRNLMDRGAEVLCVSEAFGVEDARGEWLAMEVANDLGLPACAGNELSGLYGLEMRTVTGALNASILPTALRTARMVEEAVAEQGGADIPLLVMRGDAGAASLASMKRQPLLTAFSGPAASIVGAMRHLQVHDGVVVEVGGTSTNISAVKGGRPVLSYVRVLEHVTCVRSLDVRVVGVAGGSLPRVGRRFGKSRIEDVGPRSAHIAGLPYSSFVRPEDIEGAQVHLISPKPGDPPEYVVLEGRDGRRYAPTVTCAANALREIPDGAYAAGNVAAARTAFEILGAWLDTTWEDAARRMVGLAAGKVVEVVQETIREQELLTPTIVGVGGGAGALVPTVAEVVGSPWRIPKDAEVISSVGDALSLVRVEIERTLARPSTEAVANLHREAERAAIAAGAAASTLQVESTAVPERGALRVAAFGSIALGPEGTSHDARLDEPALEAAAKRQLEAEPELIMSNYFYSVFVAAGQGPEKDFVVVDQYGSTAATGRGRVVFGVGREVAARLGETLPSLVKHFGPVAVAPAIRVVRGTRLVDLTILSNPSKVMDAAVAECALGESEPVAALISVV